MATLTVHQATPYDAPELARMLNLFDNMGATPEAGDAGLSLWLDACKRAPEDDKLPARDVASATGMEAAYLGWLLRNQRVDGTKVGGRWYTSESLPARSRAGRASTWPAKARIPRRT